MICQIEEPMNKIPTKVQASSPQSTWIMAQPFSPWLPKHMNMEVGSDDGETEIVDIYTATEESGSGDQLVESEASHTSLVYVSGSVPSQYDFAEDFVTKEKNHSSS